MVPFIDSVESVSALLFWAYIIVALLASIIVIYDMKKLYKNHEQELAIKSKSYDTSKTTDQEDCRHGVVLSLSLSLISFSVISYHMLSFLLHSHHAWLEHNRRILSDMSTDQQETLQSFPGLAQRLWQWSVEASLFSNFAKAICDGTEQFWWTQLVLVYSFSWNVFMAFKGMSLPLNTVSTTNQARSPNKHSSFVGLLPP